MKPGYDSLREHLPEFDHQLPLETREKNFTRALPRHCKHNHSVEEG